MIRPSLSRAMLQRGCVLVVGVGCRDITGRRLVDTTVRDRGSLHTTKRGGYSSERRISAGFEKRDEGFWVSRTSLRRVFVCSHITLSVEFEKPFSTPQCLQLPVLSRPFGASMIQ
jgi:hypothetical protein